MNIILTGSSGFVGLNLYPYLEEKHHIVERISLRKGGWINSINTSSDAIIHLAGKAHDTQNSSSPDEYFKINRDLTIELFDKFMNSSINYFIFFSSVKAVADSVDGVLTEDFAPVPLTPYGKSKLEAEQYILSHNLPDNKKVIIIRPCMIHGPGNKGNLNLLYKVVSKGIPWPLASFENNRSFLSINNLCFLIESILAKRDIKSGIYNFSDDVPLSTNKLIKIISSKCGKKSRLWFIPKKTMYIAARIGDLLRLPLNTERLKKLTENYVVSNSKVKDALGISNLPLTAERGLEQTISSFNK